MGPGRGGEEGGVKAELFWDFGVPRRECVTVVCGYMWMQVMKSPVVGFKAVERIDTVVNTLRSTKFNGFPVFPADRQASPSFFIPTLSIIAIIVEHHCYCCDDRQLQSDVSVDVIIISSAETKLVNEVLTTGVRFCMS